MLNLYLKRVEAKGFKSFADKIEMEFNKGITAVVGPNGSGKSNISDAVRWVLGEQSAKNLRGLKMEDIIFSGTNTRKPLGFAEVSITIDNSDNMLPVEYTEITVTRRMYRSGESEYYINGTSCRLKDINELFMDTGVGKDGYSIIGQGRVDEIINKRPEERREIFEEAAGIVKYKTRKLESEKKLESTEQNILRIEDIIRELEDQLNPLYEQSEKAKKYLNMRERLKVLELNIFMRNIEKLRKEDKDSSENISELEDELLDTNRKNARLESDHSELKEKIEKESELIEKIQNDLHTADNDLERLQGENNVLNEKVSNIDTNMSRFDEEIAGQRERINKLMTAVKADEDKLLEYNTGLDDNVKQLNLKTGSLDDVKKSIGEKEKYIDDMESQIIETMNSISEKKSSINSLNAFINNADKRKSQIVHEKSENEKKKEELEARLVEIENQIKHDTKEYQFLKDNIKSLDKEVIDESNAKRALQKDIFELNGKIQSSEARHRALSEMEAEFEGYNRSVREIMKLKARRPVFGICGVVADIIKVPKEYETAIEVALGPALQDIVTEDEYAAKNSISYLKENKFGRATFLPLTTIRGRSRIRDEQAIKLKKGFIGFANEVVEYDRKYINIISSLLGRVIVADNIDDGMIIAKSINYSIRIVTLEGDVINAGGSFTGGSLGHKASAFLGRKREIKELEKDIERFKASLSKLNERLSFINNKIASIESNLKQSDQKKQALETKISVSKNNYTMLKAQSSKLDEDLKNIEIESNELDSEKDEMVSKLEQESKKLHELETKNNDISANVQSEQSKMKDILSAKESISSEITSIKIKVAEIKQNVISIENRISDSKAEIEKCNNLISIKNDMKVKCEKEKEDVSSEIKKIKLSEGSIIKKSESLNKELEAMYKEKQNNALLIDDMEKNMKEYGKSAAILQSQIHKLEIQNAKLKMEMENLQNKIWEDYEISYAAAQEYKIEIESIGKVTSEVSGIKESIRKLGSVNVGAIDEYKRVKERYEFLKKQDHDLKDAEDSLKKVIAEITEKMKVQFAKNFAVINDNFNQVFTELFGGGRAKLILVDSDNVLESGVDIVAEPPGKKLQSLTLLSGGEKALTAIALLFAILKMKPSPFCILDEIESALDDINVARFANFLKKLSDSTQFIVVTHRKGTMEIADILYGVTMEEKGVSKLVSVKLMEKAS